MTKNPGRGYGIHSILVGLNIIKPLNITFTKNLNYMKNHSKMFSRKQFIKCVYSVF